MNNETQQLIEKALAFRLAMIKPPHNTAIRLFNGFQEGINNLVVDLYGQTLLIQDHSEDASYKNDDVPAFYRQKLPFITCVVYKNRNMQGEQKPYQILFQTEAICTQIMEHDVKYAINLLLNQDHSFYIDMRQLRHWLKTNLAGKTVLNTFAYTGSLGVAAKAGGARRVVHVDLNHRFLKVVEDSYRLNGWEAAKGELIANDFFKAIGQYKKDNQLFDCVILDPPFFSKTDSGRVDLENDYPRLINKVRPLVAHQGCIVAVNNALFASGEAFYKQLQSLCNDYMAIESIIPIAEDITGNPLLHLNQPLVNPAPFNHATKIVILRLTRKDQRPAS